MSLTIKSSHSKKDLVPFLASEYRKNTGVPVHLYSIVNAEFSSYNRCLGATDGVGTIIFESEKVWKCYGKNDPTKMMRALKLCGLKLKFID